MTQEEKQLLLKDLCARLPYGVKCTAFSDDEDMTYHGDPLRLRTISSDERYGYSSLELEDGTETIIELCKPYLRPISSMTEDEWSAFNAYRGIDGVMMPISNGPDWFNEHHFDYRGLIPMGLALEAPEGMY